MTSKRMTNGKSLSFSKMPNSCGRFGDYGGRFVPETLIAALDELTRSYKETKSLPTFKNELAGLLRDFGGRPTPLYHAERFSEVAGVNVYLKREDLNHTGAHKLNNCLGQALLATRMKKRRIIAETGAGQHGLATATVCARFGLECVIYMGAHDVKRQSTNVRKMKLMGAQVVAVTAGNQTLKDATNEALRDWVANVRNTFYVIGSAVGPHPYPMIVRDFQSVIGKEARQQYLAKIGKLPSEVVACVGGGSNAIGIMSAFLDDRSVALTGVEAGGEGLRSGRHSATLSCGTPGVLHGSLSYLLSSADGQITLPHSISAGLDYPGVGPEHSFLKDCRRVSYVSVTDKEAVDAFVILSRTEGIIPALESSHAMAYVLKMKRRSIREKKSTQKILVCLSGRGDKDLDIVSDYLGGPQ